MNTEQGDDRTRDNIVPIGGDSRHEHHQGVVVSGRGDRFDDVASQYFLTLGALNVYDRGFARDGDRFRNTANAYLRVHGRGQRAGQLEAFAFYSGKSG